MKTTFAAAGMILIALTWLALRGMNPGAPRFDRALQALDQFSLVERALQREILSDRIGTLRNYDPLVRETNALRKILDQLRESASGNHEESEALDRLAASTDRQEDLTEQLKSEIALLRNSLTYFSLFSSRLRASRRNDPSLPTVNALSAAMLHLTLDTSIGNVRDVDVWLRDLKTWLPTTGDPNSVKALLAHGSLLRKLLPQTDGLLADMFALRTESEQVALRKILTADQLASRKGAQDFRIFLYSLSLMLLALLVFLGLKLRARAHSMYWRAALEHVIAGVSTSLINCRPDDTATRIEEALGRIAKYIGANRAYFIPSSQPDRMYASCSDGEPFAPDWQDQAIELARNFSGNNGIIHIPDVNSLPPSKSKSTLTTLGIRSWTCVLNTDADSASGVLGFDAMRNPITTPAGDLRLLRMAFDAIVSAVTRDRLARERMHLEHQLQQARRMETVGALASGIAHNFNNICGAVLGYVEIAEAHLHNRSRATESLAEIRCACARGRDLIEQILTFGRRRTTRRVPVQMAALIAESKSLLLASLSSNIELVVHDVPDAVVCGELAQLQQVILNLCHNAAQAMNESGRIEIKTEVREVARPVSFDHADLGKGRYAVVSVSDSGCGMTKSMMARIFEPFFTARPAGNGLGLSTAAEIVRGHEGAIAVKSRPGLGSCFEVWLPCRQSEHNESKHSVELPFITGRGETVLVLEDDENRLLRDEEILAALGYEPVGFSAIFPALSACKANPQRFDAFLIGHLSSIGSAISVSSKLHQISPDCPILLAARSAIEIDANALISAGICEIVRWPLIPGEVVAALNHCLGAPRRRQVALLPP